MALSTSLHLRQSQSLVMTPQLMQSIRLLQLTYSDLAQFVEQEIEKNPLLEQGPAAGDEAPEPDEPWPRQATSDDVKETGTPVAHEDFELPGDGDETADPGSRRERADGRVSPSGTLSSLSTGGFDIDNLADRSATLAGHVNEQIALTAFSTHDRLIAGDLADHLDETGYLRSGCDEAARRLGVTRQAIESVLCRLQTFDPPGIFARSLGECLSIQLAQRNRLDPAMAVVLSHLDLLARRDFQALKRLCGVDEDDLVDMLGEIKALDPKPGNRFHSGAMQAIVPDVIVTAGDDGAWQIELNPETMPKVLVNQSYYAEVSSAAPRNSPDRDFLNTCLQNANWLTRSLDQRAKTIVKVTSEIVKQQDRFLVDGVGHLRPLNLKAVAEAIGMHESTVSRVTSNKYMLTPRGVFELKYFFTVPIAASGGGDAHSAETVRHRIKTMIADETPMSILSDDLIVTRLTEDGIEIARRTVAKYREAMNIPSSVQRRREKRALARAHAI